MSSCADVFEGLDLLTHRVGLSGRQGVLSFGLMPFVKPPVSAELSRFPTLLCPDLHRGIIK